ncbi:hypothetical protein [Haloarcula laminariae]|uniref:hypothetical protein n=1 Tax=Haloarcula laminariae TaxID=2961577 RepID=UPI002404B336|nr:hypothetical protein [Halomicroarcula sp. FL173]
MSLTKRQVAVALFVLFSAVVGATVAGFKLATDTTMIVVLAIGVIATIAAVRQQRTVES